MFLLVSDLHLHTPEPFSKGKSYQLDDFTAEKLEIFRLVALQKKYSAVILLGDTFHDPNPNHFLRRDFVKIINEIIENGSTVVILIGNHDSNDGYDHCLMGESVIKQEKLLIVGREPVIGNRGIYLGWTPDDEIVSRIESLPPRDFLFLHVLLKGASIRSSYQSKSGVDLSIFKKFKIVFSGDVHVHQGMGNFIYVGSLYRNNWGEWNNEPKYIELDESTGSFSVCSPRVTEMADLVFSESDSYVPLGVPEGTFIRVTLKGSAEWIGKTREHTRKHIIDTLRPRKLFMESDYVVKEIPRMLISNSADPFDSYCVEKNVDTFTVETGKTYLSGK